MLNSSWYVLIGYGCGHAGVVASRLPMNSSGWPPTTAVRSTNSAAEAGLHCARMAPRNQWAAVDRRSPRSVGIRAGIPSLSRRASPFGVDPVPHELSCWDPFERAAISTSNVSTLDEDERDVIVRIYHDYGKFSGPQLSNLTRRGSAPWERVYADGAGKFRDIPHRLVRAQFVRLATKRND